MTPERTELLEMLSYRRPHGSTSERKFINRYIGPLNPDQDAHGNFIKIIGTRPNILFSSHTDSVHQQGGRQRLAYMDAEQNIVGLGTDGSNCLGADCATGVWLMRQMILAKVPGVYVFHRQEEHGGVGSSALCASPPDWMDDLGAAVALDRRGRSSIITHQSGIRCCSDAFGNSMRQLLGPHVGDTALDTTGVYTDTSEYTGLVGECTNISVGYDREHTAFETQDLDHAEALLAALLNADWSLLVFERKPGEADPDYYGYPYGSGYYSFNDNREYSKYPSYSSSPTGTGEWARLVRTIRSYPEAAADMLEHLGYTADDLMDHMSPFNDLAA